MISRLYGRVSEIHVRTIEKEEILVETEEGIRKAINYPLITGNVMPEDEVLLNATAVDLNLGTGGYDFVVAILSRKVPKRGPFAGHIMKARYTPHQLAFPSIEEEDHPLYSSETRMGNLNGTPILILSLHSMLPVVLRLIHRKRKDLKTVYIMTDGAALPIWLSNHVKQLKDEGILTRTITAGQAFGGDVESVTHYSAILAAKYSLKADIILIGPGPGGIGTNHPFGSTSAVEMGEMINAVSSLNGVGILVPRIQSMDGRGRHFGLSHHTITALARIALAPVYLPLPRLGGALEERIKTQIKEWEISDKHYILWQEPEDWEELRQLFKTNPVQVMGRDLLSDPPYLFSIAASVSCYLSKISQ